MSYIENMAMEGGVVQGAESLSLPDFACDPICQPSNEDEMILVTRQTLRYMTVHLQLILVIM